MYWMRPVYLSVKIEHPLNFKYKLYLYREYSNNVNLNGKPLLFVHGNAGSHKQVRSIGGAVEFKWEKERKKEKFDVFVVDFNEEYSGIQGNVLLDQTDFVTTCINFILNDLYNGKYKSMITIGHSIGGLVLRGSLLNPNYQKGSIDTIITLSTPHQKHGFIVDLSLSNYYEKVNNFWKNTPNINIPILSISGGYRDILVNHENTLLNNVSSHFVSVSSYEMEDVLFSMDHYCVTWCKQFIDRLASILFELINTKDLTIDKKIEILKKIKLSANIEITETKESININQTSSFIATNLRYKVLRDSKKEYLIIHSNQYFSVYKNLILLKSNNLPFIRVDSENEVLSNQPNDVGKAYTILQLKDDIHLQTSVNSRLIFYYFKKEKINNSITFLDLLFGSFIIKNQTGFLDYKFLNLPRDIPFKVKLINTRKEYLLSPFAKNSYRVFENATEFVIKSTERKNGVNFKIFIDPNVETDLIIEISWIDLLSNILRYYTSTFVVLIFSFYFFYLSTNSYHSILLFRIPIIFAYLLMEIHFIYSFFLIGFSFSIFVFIHLILTFFSFRRLNLKIYFFIISILSIFTNSGIYTFISFFLLFSSNESVLLFLLFLIQGPSLLSLKDFIKYGYGINQENYITKLLVILLFLDIQNFEKTKKWKFDVIGFFISFYCMKEIPLIYYSFALIFILNQLNF